MAKKSNLMVYVEKGVMEQPHQLFDAVITHMIKKDLDIAKRRQFIVDYQKAIRQGKDPLTVIHEWVQVRDVAGFPFRNEPQVEENANESEGIEGGVPVDDGADGEEVNGEAPRNGSDTDDGSGDTGNKRKRNKR